MPAIMPRSSAELTAHDGATTLGLRQELAQKAFARTAAYDAAISNWLARANRRGRARPIARSAARLPQALRYGENPHQSAAFYASGEQRRGVATARQVQGKELSYNNVNDTDAAFELVAEFDPARTAAVAIIKHANPCGVAEAASLAEAYEQALALRSGLGLRRHRRARTARSTRRPPREIVKIFTEVIIAPDADDEAIAIVAAKKNLRLLLTGGLPDPRAAGLTFRTGRRRLSRAKPRQCQSSTTWICRSSPSARRPRRNCADLQFAFRVAKHVKSNAIVYAKDGATVGIGAGQMSRVDSAAHRRDQSRRGGASAAGLPESLAQRLGRRLGRVLPVRRRPAGRGRSRRDGGHPAGRLGARRRGHQGRRRSGLAMVFTGMRHFRH